MKDFFLYTTLFYFDNYVFLFFRVIFLPGCDQFRKFCFVFVIYKFGDFIEHGKDIFSGRSSLIIRIPEKHSEFRNTFRKLEIVGRIFGNVVRCKNSFEQVTVVAVGFFVTYRKCGEVRGIVVLLAEELPVPSRQELFRKVP